MVMEGIQEDMGDGSMTCTEHPYKNNTPGGICAFCLQEKLGKLVSSSFPASVFPSSSSSSTTPSFRSDFAGPTSSTSASTTLPPLQTINNKDCYFNHYDNTTIKKSRMPFLLPHKKNKNKKKDGNNGSSVVTSGSSSNVGISMKRSKSTTTPRNHFLDNNEDHGKRFWSFLYYSSSSKKTEKHVRDISIPSCSREKKKEEFVVVEENDESPACDRKVSRSRSVGCGSRSFSGDFFERISTGFGDCTLRRVESQREGKSNNKVHRTNNGTGQDCSTMKERVRCGGLFSGFLITSSSSSSSSSSHWVSSEENVNGKSTIAQASVVGHHHNQLVNGRSKSWGWAFASPMRAFSTKTSSSSSGKRDASNKNATPNLAVIPSLLTARG